MIPKKSALNWLVLVLLAVILVGCGSGKRPDIIVSDPSVVERSEAGWVLEKETNSLGTYLMAFRNVKTNRRSVVTVNTIKSGEEIGKTELVALKASLRFKGFRDFKDARTQFKGKTAYKTSATHKENDVVLVMYSFKDNGFYVAVATFSRSDNIADQAELEALYDALRSTSS